MEIRKVLLQKMNTPSGQKFQTLSSWQAGDLSIMIAIARVPQSVALQSLQRLALMYQIQERMEVPALEFS